MKHRFHSLTFVAMLAWAGIACGQSSGNTDSRQRASDARPRPSSPGQALTGQTLTGQALVAEAARRVARETAISAEMRYKIDAFGHELVGTGSYAQFGGGPEKLVRLDLRLQAGERPATVQEIRGADVYWVRRDVPPMPASLGRVDLKQLRKSLAQSSGLSAGDVLPQGDWIMLGGLARLLSALEENFAFGTPKAEELTFGAADGKSLSKLPIWIVHGQWKPQQLAELVGKEPGKIGSLPEQLPDRVELMLGRTEDILPLFPYRITYWRTPATGKKAKDAAPAAPLELLTLELFNVSRKPIDAREFEYQPGDQEVQELTQFYAQRFAGQSTLR